MLDQGEVNMDDIKEHLVKLNFPTMTPQTEALVSLPMKPL